MVGPEGGNVVDDDACRGERYRQRAIPLLVREYEGGMLSPLDRIATRLLLTQRPYGWQRQGCKRVAKGAVAVYAPLRRT